MSKIGQFRTSGFESCEAGRDTRMGFSGQVRWPECKPGCVEETGHQLNGVEYLLPNARCLRAKGNCLGCLEDVVTNKDNSKHIRTNFESCTPDADTRFPFRQVTWPICKSEGCLDDTGHQINGWWYHMADGRCLQAKGDCQGCLEEAEGRGNNAPNLTRAFDSCYPDQDSRFNHQEVNFPDCKPGCVERTGNQFSGWNYIMPDGRCIKAKGNCQGCLEDVLDKKDNSPHLHTAFESCQTDVDTRFPHRQAGWPHCKPTCVTGTGNQINGWEYHFADGRCVKARGNCLGCLEEVQSQGNNALKLATDFESCDTNQDTRFIIRNVDFPGCKPGCVSGTGNQFSGWNYTLPDGRCLKAKGTCVGCLEDVLTNKDSSQHIHSNFESCRADHDTRFPHRQAGWPHCKPACVTGTGNQLNGWEYHFADGRCVKARGNCLGCLEEVQSHGNNAPNLARAFESCDTNQDTRFIIRNVDFPSCKPGCVSGTGNQFDGWNYTLPDGRCLKAKGTCQGCLEAVHNDRNWPRINEAFDTCVPGRDTRY